MQQVPEKGSVVEILDTLNLSRGGEAVDVTSYVSDELKTIVQFKQHQRVFLVLLALIL